MNVLTQRATDRTWTSCICPLLAFLKYSGAVPTTGYPLGPGRSSIVFGTETLAAEGALSVLSATAFAISLTADTEFEETSVKQFLFWFWKSLFAAALLGISFWIALSAIAFYLFHLCIHEWILFFRKLILQISSRKFSEIKKNWILLRMNYDNFQLIHITFPKTVSGDLSVLTAKSRMPHCGGEILFIVSVLPHEAFTTCR